MQCEIISTPLRDLKSYLRKIETDQIVLICDQNIATIYAPLMEELRQIAGKSILYWCGASGEQNKTFEQYVRCVNELLTQGIHRNTHLVAIGGGGLSDFAGFVAATILRGIPWSVVPTTLLAQIDAGVGGKTAINLPQGKNLVGSFHFPRNIFICEEFLLTLDEEDCQSGFGELIKYALLSREIFEAVNSKMNLSLVALLCAKFKQDIVNRDPKEERERKYLNLGHTFGHAYECLTGDTHGVSVLWGIEYIDKNFLDGRLKENYGKLLETLQFSPHFYEVQMSDLFEYLRRDKKKISRDEIQLVLLEDVGRPYLKTFSLNELRKS